MSLWQRIKMFFGWKPSLEEVLEAHPGPVIIVYPPKPINPVKPVAPVVPPLKQSRFDKAIEYVLKNEGPFSNNPKDPGGATMHGVILSEYAKFLGRKSWKDEKGKIRWDMTADEVEKMPLSTAKAIYLKEFWKPIRGDEYTSEAIAIAIMDTAVNKGLGGCMSCLKAALDNGDLSRYGDDTIQAVNILEPNHFMARFRDAVLRYIDHRIAVYPNMEWARKGWNNRAKRLMELLK